MHPSPSSSANGRPTPTLRVEALAKRYRTGDGVERADLEVLPGEVVALLGPNGSGKTTTMRCVVGLLVPDEGRVEVVGSAPGTVTAQRATCFLPDSPDLYPALSVEEHLRFRAQAFGLGGDLDARIAAALEELDVADLADRLGGELSRGQRQRTMLAAALLQDAALFLLDEPTVGLDPPAARWLTDWLRLRARLGGAVLVATHSLDFVVRTADRVVLMRGGRSVGTEVVPREREAHEAWQDEIVGRLSTLGSGA